MCAICFHATKAGERLPLVVSNSVVLTYSLITRFVRGKHRLQVVVRALIRYVQKSD